MKNENLKEYNLLENVIIKRSKSLLYGTNKKVLWNDVRENLFRFHKRKVRRHKRKLC